MGRLILLMCGYLSVSDGPEYDAQVGADPRKQPTAKLWALGVGDRGACPWGFAFQPPATAKENYVLRSLLHSSNQSDAWLPLTGARSSSLIPTCTVMLSPFP